VITSAIRVDFPGVVDGGTPLLGDGSVLLRVNDQDLFRSRSGHPGNEPFGVAV
jgi:hypothetical protein